MNFKFKTLIIIFVAVIVTNILFKELNEEVFQNNLLIKIISKLILLIITIILLKYSLIIKFKFSKRSIFFLAASVIITSLAFLYIRDEIVSNKLAIDSYNHFLFLLSCFSVGLFEELFFRIFMFLFMLKIFEGDNRKFLKSITITSLLFGLAHYSNFLDPEYDVLSVLNQSLFAVAIGILLQSIYIRTNSLIFIVTIHSLINYFGTYKSRLFEVKKEYEADYDTGDFFSTLLTIFTFLIIAIICSYFLVVNSKTYMHSKQIKNS